MKSLITATSLETKEFGQIMAADFKGGEVLALSGDLGSGKTVFAQGVAKGLGVKGRVNSPTFNIFKVYKVNANSKIKFFCHVDAYRLTSAHDLESIGLNDYMGDKQTVVLIEWAEKVRGLLPKSAKFITIKHVNTSHRQINYK